MSTKLSARLETLLNEVVDLAESNPAFKKRLEQYLAPTVVSPSTKRHRRAKGVIDPISLFDLGEDKLRKSLESLDTSQLKDIIAEHGMDTQKLAMKWKNRERLVELIVSTTRGRIEKGSAFRRQK